MARRTIRTPKKEAKFLAALQGTCNVRHACEAANIAPNSVYLWKRDDPEFSRKWEQALEIGSDTLEAEAIRRARDGVDEPVFYQGEVCGTVRKYSDTLLIFLLKGHKPERYSEKVQTELTGKNGAPLVFSLEKIG